MSRIVSCFKPSANTCQKEFALRYQQVNTRRNNYENFLDTNFILGTKVLAVGKYVVIGGAVVGVGAFFVSRAGFSLASLAIGAATNVIQHAGSAVTSLANRLNQPASITASMIPDKLEEIPDVSAFQQTHTYHRIIMYIYSYIYPGHMNKPGSRTSELRHHHHPGQELVVCIV